MRSLIPSFLLLPLIACLHAIPTPGHAQSAPSPTGRPGWELVWSDEFNYTGLPDKTKWGYEEGFVRNKENQFYTRERKENARVENGMLIIEARKESYKNPAFKPGSTAAPFAEYTSASLITLHKASWQYGRIEVRAKVPTAKGVWPAIWTLGENFSPISGDAVRWPACGEIDIMEFYGARPGLIFGTLHYNVDGKHQSSREKITVEGLESDFHIYAVEWSTDRIDFFCDGNKYYSFAVNEAGKGENNPFRKPQYLLLNLALGGSSGGAIEDSKFPVKFLIDYVRVYKRIGDMK